jgi:eukaryotic-like serine/threonine-protein kinase
MLAEEFSDDVGVGLVIRTDPPAGTEVARDSVVTLVVSRGPDLVTVPNIAGFTADAAQAALAEVGLVGEVATAQLGGTVVSADPAIGTQVRRGSTVRVTLAPALTTTTAGSLRTLLPTCLRPVVRSGLRWPHHSIPVMSCQ